MNIKKAVAHVLIGATIGIGPLVMQPAFAGKPADGTVGKADNKSPKGQSDGDKNAGYECDRNHGVGQGNPAHSNNCEEAPPDQT